MAALLLAAACGSKQPSGPTAPTATPKEEAPTIDIGAAYAAFSHEKCAAAGPGCLGSFIKLAGGSPTSRHNPRQGLRNPDPEWLLEWDKLPTVEGAGRYTYAAVALAAIERTWAATCAAEYEKHKKAADQRLSELRQKYEKEAQNPNPYDRIAGMLALAPPKTDKPLEFGSFGGVERFEYEKALFAAFEQTKRTFLYTFEGYAPSDAAMAVMRPRGDDAFERDAFCLALERGEIEGVARRPDTSSWDRDVKAMVRAAVSPGRAEVIAARRAELNKQAHLHFAKARVPSPTLPPGMREYTLKGIKTFARDGKLATLARVETKQENTATKRVQVDEVAQVVFADWPSGVVLEPGDTVSFYGREVRVKDTVIVSTKQLEHINRDFELEGAHVTSIVTKEGTKKYFR